MTLIGTMTMPHFDESERAELRRIEGILSKHPYMRADLGDCGPVAHELEHVLSARLAFLHTQRTSDRPPEERVLLAKLRAWEAKLLALAADEPGSAPALLRYETTVLLHPQPGEEGDGAATTARRTHATTRWEGARACRSARAILNEKLRQSRDFLRHGAMLPFYWARRGRIRKLVPGPVLRDAALRETFFAIEQVGPLVDNFAFEGKAGVPIAKDVAIADLAFLYMQLADEFLDELAAAVGGHDAAGRVVRSVYDADTSKRPLHNLTLAELNDTGIDANAHLTKFGLSLRTLFEVLDELSVALDDLLFNADDAVVGAAHRFLHHCFQTYLDEVDLRESAADRRADSLPLRDTAWHFYRKNNMVMMLWLDLRARLLGLTPADHAAAIRRWGYLLAAFQIFDDLKDIALDLGNQPSYPLQIAAEEFPAELRWLEDRFGEQRGPMTRDEVREVSLRASNTVLHCMQWSRLIALSHFDNALLYAWDQRWRKSWTRRRASFNPRGSAPVPVAAHVADRLVRALISVRGREPQGSMNDAELAYALDASAYDGAWQIYLALFPDLRAIYRFATLRMFMTAEEKARAARRLLRRYPRTQASALVELAEMDVHHEIPGDRLEARSKLLEI